MVTNQFHKKKRRQSSPLTTTKPHNSLKKIMREILDVLTFDLTLIIVIRLIDFTIFLKLLSITK